MSAITIEAHSTPLGTMWSHWTDAGLHRLSWDVNEPDEGFFVEPPLPNIQRAIADFAVSLQNYFSNGQETFRSVTVDPSNWTDFHRRVYECCGRINPGELLTYKHLAGRAGNDKASRAVGSAMARNRIVLVIPCHRVIASGGKLGGYSAADGLITKQQLIDHEQARSTLRAAP